MGTYRIRINHDDRLTKRFRPAAMSILLLLLTATANAEVIVQYDGTLFTPSTQATNISGGTMTNASMTNLTKGGSTYTSSPIYFLFPASGATSSSTAVSTSSYFSFSVTPTDLEMDLTSLTFDAARGGSGTPRGYVLRSSIDSYANNITTASIGTVRPTFTSFTIDLSGASYQNLTSAVTFRIYAYSPGTTSTVDMDTITLNGTLTSTVGGGGGTTTSQSFDDAPPTLTRYIQIQRTGTTVTAKLYSDPSFTTQVGSTLTVTDTGTAYRYLYAPIANNTGVTSTTFSGSVSELDINVQTGSTCSDTCDLCATEATCTASAATCFWWTNSSCNAFAQPSPPAGGGTQIGTIGVYVNTGGQLIGCSVQ